MIRINLTGDYDLIARGNVTELSQLDAFLGALRGSIAADSDVFLSSVAKITETLKRRNYRNVALQITSELVGNKLTHNFRIVEI